MVHDRSISSHSLLPDRFFVFCVARLLDPALALGALFDPCACPSLALGVSIEAPLAPVDRTWTARFQKKAKKRLPANGPRGKTIRGG